MRHLVTIGGLVLVGVLAWAIGSRLSTDAVGMGVGLLFGVLAGVPTALLMLAGMGPRDRYSEGYNAGKRDAADIMLNRRPDWAQRELQQAQPPVIVVQPTYTAAHPFAIAPANVKRCHDCPVPHAPCVADARGVLPCEYADNPPVDDDSPDWPTWWAWQRRIDGRQFRITGEVDR